MSEGIISPLSLSSESSEQQQAAIRKFSNGSNGSGGGGSNLSVNSSNSNSNSGGSSNSIRKSSTLMYNGPLPSINDGKELLLENSKPKVVELVNTFNHKPLSTIHSVHNEIPPPAIEKEKKEIINTISNSGVTKYMTALEILDSTINTPLNRSRSGSTGSKPIFNNSTSSSTTTTTSTTPSSSSTITSSNNNNNTTSTTNTNTNTTTTTSISISSSPPSSTSNDEQFNNNNNNNSGGGGSNRMITSKSQIKPLIVTSSTAAATTTTTTNTSAPTTPTNRVQSSLDDLLFNLPTIPSNVPTVNGGPKISAVPKKVSSTKLLIPPSSNVSSSNITLSSSSPSPSSPSTSTVVPIVQLSSLSSNSTNSPSTSLPTTPRLSQPTTSYTQLIPSSSQQQQQQQQQSTESNSNSNTNTTTSSSSSSLSVSSPQPSNNSIRISAFGRSSTQFTISSNGIPSSPGQVSNKDYNNIGNFSNSSGERVKNKQYSMLNISKKTILDESDISSSPRSIGSPNSIRASISSQLPPSLSSIGGGSGGSGGGGSSGPNAVSNKPLVVKKPSTSEHIKKENIWRQTMIPLTKEDHIKVVFEGIPGKRVIQKFLIDKTPIEIKSKFFEDLKDGDLLNGLTQLPSLIPEHYELKVLSVNSTISNETLPLRRQTLMQACNISRLFPKLHLILKPESTITILDGASTTTTTTTTTATTNQSSNIITKSNSSLDLTINNSNEIIDVKGHIQAELEIFELIGTSFTRVLDQGQEVVSFRRDFAQFRLSNFTSTRNDLSQMIYVSSEPLPLTIPNKITIMVLLPGDGKIIKRVDCCPNSSVGDVKKEIFKKFAMIDRVHTQGKTQDDFVLKVTGFREYILCIHELGNLTSRQRFYPTGSGGDFSLIDYDYIRQCVGKNQTVELSLTNNSILSLNQVSEKVSFIDKILETSDFDDYDEDLDSINSNSFDDLKQSIQQQQQQQIQTVINIKETKDSNKENKDGNKDSSNKDNNNNNGNNSNNNSNISRGSIDSEGNGSGNGSEQPTLIGVQNFSLPNNSKLPINIVKRLFRVNIAGLRNLNFNNNEDARNKFADGKNNQPNVFVMAELYYGGELLTNPVFTPIAQLASYGDGSVEFPNWEKGIAFTIPIRYLPRAARASFTVYVTTISEALESQMDEVVSKSIPIGWSNCLLMNHKGMLRMGPTAFRLWDDGRRANPIGTCVDNQAAKQPIILLVEFESFIRPIVYVDTALQSMMVNDSSSISSNGVESPSIVSFSSSAASSSPLPSSPLPSPVGLKKLDLDEARRLKALMDSDPLVQLSAEDKKLVYGYRHIYKSKPKALAKFLLSVNWIDPDQVTDAYRQMNDWALLRPVQALEILDAKFADEHVRNFAIKIINSFSDAEFSDFLLQLTQVLKYEPYHNSDLTHILIQRALSNRSRIGHFFFWFLKSEMHTPEIEERYGLLLEGYLRSCGTHRQDLIKQNQVLKSLHTVAMAVKQTNGSSERKKVLMEGLSKIKFPDTFQLPLDPRWEAKGLIIDKCRYMDSKKLPLWLVFENVEPHAKPLTVIFKVGDDLRQDILTLQVLRIMDKFWKNSGMDLRLQPYKCIATGDGIGMLEVVLNANTIANINKDAGGTGALLEEKTLVNWLKECNKTEAEYNKAVETFILSCAGYVVATYVMGIGDRHSDNIMITKLGHLFHIDFGHFLGNYKKKYGFKRERAPFIFTPQYMAIVGGKDSENFKRFVTTCCSAYNILRKNTDLFINLFQLMLSTGIPELQVAEDIDYLRKALAPGLSDEEAAEEFTKNISVALNTKTVLLNDIFHGWAH
ncbi:hypothetical protein ACTFIW_007561 [Dictyostelium discoideum]